jgi:lipoprotein NlpI
MIRFVLAMLIAVSVFAAEKPATTPALGPYEELILQAKDATGKRLLGKALESLEQAIKLDPKRFDAYFLQGQILAAQRKSEEAIKSFSKVIEIDPKASTAYEDRGEEKFKLGQIDAAIEDYNRYIALEPQQEPYHWKRGIAYYYAGKYGLGRKQFELHRTVNPNDVENGVWHFMCVAREKGFEKARESMMPIFGDYRVPMSEVYEMFRGKATADDVMKATQKGDPSKVELEARQFYAHLYIGLYFEAKGDKEKAYEHIKSAATEFEDFPPMGAVARVHFQKLLEQAGAKAK